MTVERCIGCGAEFHAMDGPVHDYMHSSPACFAAFNALLAAEYSSPALMGIHRLTVDTWAVQHPGEYPTIPGDRRAIQSVGLHLARLMLQLEHPRPPTETNAVMLDFSRYKSTLKRLTPPAVFTTTVAEIAPFAASPSHIEKVRGWAQTTWNDWSADHAYIRQWIADHSAHQGG